MASLGLTVRLFHCDIEVLGLGCGNNLFVKTGVRLCTLDPYLNPNSMGVLYIEMPFWESCI
uniref:Uncharacterized protein n=1 Tax=Rhizophora mucronata TaxID=61149 RepID=A0A2P2KMX4_RHIMU